MRNLPSQALILTASLILAAPAMHAAVRFVDLNSASPTPPYTNWATAATNIQDAVDAAVSGDQILVTNGVYQTGGKAVFGLTNRVVVDKSLVLQSVNGPQVTLIDGGGSVRCVRLANGSGLTGFTLTNGFAGNSVSGGGVAFGALYSDAIVSNCVIVGCGAGYGGGVGTDGPFGSHQPLGGTLNNCILRSNSAVGPATFPAFPGGGGGAYGATLNNCTLTGNSAASGGGAASSRLQNCILTGNSAWISGGGTMYSGLVNCTLIGNSASSAGGGASASTLNNSIVYYNAAPFAINDSDCTLNYSCTTPMPPFGLGNITNEPLFVDYAGGHLRLQSNSPCINAGSNDSVTNPVDLGGWERIVDGTVDMGAYEWVAMPTHYVSLSSPNPTPPYLSWSTAATNIQDAVNRALPAFGVVHRVLVTNGLYQSGSVSFGSGSAMWPNRLTVRSPVWVESVNGPEVTAIQGTDGRLARCVYVGRSSSVRLSGFTLAGGTTLDGIAPADPDASLGGGVFCQLPTTIVSNCILKQCTGGWGGGVSGGTLVNCTVISNSVWGGGGGAYGSELHHCTLTDNFATNDYYGGGGALGCSLFDCMVKRNSVGTWFDHNGGGAYRCFLQNSVLSDNSADLGGGAGRSTLVNCTVIKNSAAIGGGVWRCYLWNSIIHGNTATLGPSAGPNYWRGDYERTPPEGGLDFCCTAFDWITMSAGTGNVFAEPGFVDQASGYLRLQSNSPCINSGLNAYAPADPDLDGNPRITGGTVDIGAYEFQSPSSVLSYAWAQQYGLPTDGSADDADSDGDLMTNWQEWIAGTDPIDPASALRLLSPTKDASGVTVSWQSVSNRTYFLERAGNLRAQPPFSLLTSNVLGQAGTTRYTDTNAFGPGSFLYRVGVQQ